MHRISMVVDVDAAAADASTGLDGGGWLAEWIIKSFCCC